MSLNDAANYLKLHGRGNDTELVHMSKDEVNSLRQLAQSHGGDLSVNPHTGLKEAGFLDSILPMIIGGATAVFAPEALPYVSGAVGLGSYAKSGSLMKGISAGMGAYGAGSLATGLAASGYASAADSAVNSAVNSAAGQGLTGEAYNKAIQDSVTQSMATNGTNSFGSNVMGGIGEIGSGSQGALGYGQVAKYGAMAASPAILNSMNSGSGTSSQPNTARITPYTYASNPVAQTNPIGAKYVPGQDTSERTYFNPQYTALPPYTYTSADGGQVPPPTSFGNPNAPMSQDKNTTYANYSQMPMPQNPMDSVASLMANGGISSFADGKNAMTADGQLIDPATGMPYPRYSDPLAALANMGQSGQHFSTPFATGGETGGHLGDYSDGGRLLRGPGDGVSDSIPATIAGKQPARLADGEFVVPARIVSELGNGSTEAGARKLYGMLDRIQNIRRESVGKGKVAKDSKADRYLPA
jgi:hypothetical protein